MHARTTTAMALAGVALAVPAAAHAAPGAIEPPSPTATALRAPVAGHLTVRAQMRAARAHTRRVRLSAVATRLARRVAAERDREFRRARFRARLRGDGAATLRARVRDLRGDLRAARTEGARAVTPGYLQAIAACESGGNPATNTGNGFYGKYQFTLSSWEAVGGSGNPAEAPEAEQDRRAAMLYAQQGSSPWPVCGR